MKRWLSALLLVLLLPAAGARGQAVAFGNMPVDIVNADQTYFENGVAIAEGNVIIQYAETTIYADYGEYHTETHDVLVRGHVRIYRQGEIFVGERAVYNLETKKLHAANFEGDFYPFRMSADSLSTIGTGQYLVRDASVTTSDSSVPDYQLRAKSARIYQGQRIILRNVTLYVGNLPVFWWPYLYQPLRRDLAYSIRPGYYSGWGLFALSQWNFPIADNWGGVLHVDYRQQRGLGLGLDTDYRFGPNDASWGHFSVYYAPDEAPPTIAVGSNNDKVTSNRYRVSLQDRVYLTDDLYASVDVTKLSDIRMLEDFMPNEYRLDPQPDNVASLTQWTQYYTLSVTYRKQLNDFNEVTEQVPTFALDVTRHAVTEGSNLFYDGETSFARMHHSYSTSELAQSIQDVSFTQPGQQKTVTFPQALQNYGYNRFDTYHEIIYPMEFWKFLSFVPRLGLRGDYYSQTGEYENVQQDVTVNDLLPNTTLKLKGVNATNNTTVPLNITAEENTTELETHGGVFRGVIDGGFESSFKTSREYPGVESRALGLDDLRHVIQPYMDLSMAATTENPNKLLQIDRYQPSTQLPMYNYPGIHRG